jgi:hypothetical protein
VGTGVGLVGEFVGARVGGVVGYKQVKDKIQRDDSKKNFRSSSMTAFYLILLTTYHSCYSGRLSLIRREIEKGSLAKTKRQDTERN